VVARSRLELVNRVLAKLLCLLLAVIMLLLTVKAGMCG